MLNAISFRSFLRVSLTLRARNVSSIKGGARARNAAETTGQIMREYRNAAPAQNIASAVAVAASDRPRRSGELPADDCTRRRLTRRSQANDDTRAKIAAKE